MESVPFPMRCLFQSLDFGFCVKLLAYTTCTSIPLFQISSSMAILTSHFQEKSITIVPALYRSLYEAPMITLLCTGCPGC